MRIAIVRSTLHRGSGQTVHIRELSRRLIELGNKVSIFGRTIEDPVLSKIGAELRSPLDGIPFVRHFGFATACLSGIGRGERLLSLLRRRGTAYTMELLSKQGLVSL